MSFVCYVYSWLLALCRHFWFSTTSNFSNSCWANGIATLLDSGFEESTLRVIWSSIMYDVVQKPTVITNLANSIATGYEN